MMGSDAVHRWTRSIMYLTRSPAGGLGRTDGQRPPPPDADTAHPPDEMLLAGLGLGDAEAARAFVRRFQRTVFGVALAVLGDQGLAEDVAQQAFEHAWRHAELYDPRRGSVRAWLCRITHNLAVDTARIRRPAPVQSQDLQLLLGPASDDPEAHALANEAAGELRRTLAGLPDHQARALVMAAVHGLTAAQIADLERVPLGTAKARIRAAMTKLHARASGRSQRGYRV
ncbi:MAG: sigma-70 family RNA polymerase sigma factor [Pseudonocardia sp.]|nr:sigma-70 family RNA polymerase sigma factor [Pseudonocardia sp.]